MKTLRNTLFILVALFVFASCSKKEEEIAPATTPGTELVGQYKVSHYRLNNEPQQNLPANRSIIIKFVPVNDTQAHLLIDDTQAGQASSDDDYGNVDLVRVGSRIDIRIGAATIGTYANGSVELEFEQSNGMVRFFAKRQ